MSELRRLIFRAVFEYTTKGFIAGPTHRSLSSLGVSSESVAKAHKNGHTTSDIMEALTAQGSIAGLL